MNVWKRTKEGVTNRTNVHCMLDPKHTDAQTNIFFLVEKWTRGEVNRHQKFETIENDEKAPKYTRTFIGQNI